MTAEEILQSKYLQFKNTWSLPPVDPKYKEMVLEAMEDYAKKESVTMINGIRKEFYDIETSNRRSGERFNNAKQLGRANGFKAAIQILDKYGTN